MTQSEAMQNLPELFKFWLQDQVNVCVAGHEARLDRLEQEVRDMAYTLRRHEVLLAQLAGENHE